MCEAEEALALLLASDIWDVDDLVYELQYGDQPDESRERYRIYIALAWLHDHPEVAEDPLEVVELLVADFDYPPELEGLVRYMQPPPWAPTGLDAVRQRWATYVDEAACEYKKREAEM